MARYLGLAGVAMAAATLWIAAMPEATTAPAVAFRHARHTGLACAVCHSGVERGARAGLPEVTACQRCHATPPASVSDAAWREAARGAILAWRPATTPLPDHSRFSHRRHVAAARLACASCHGEVGLAADPNGRAPVRLDMDGCLSCHEREGVSADCAACHR